MRDDGRDAAVDRQHLPGDVLAGLRREQQRRALEVVVVADAQSGAWPARFSAPIRAIVPLVILLGNIPGASALTLMLSCPIRGRVCAVS
jgi:hypothetical protein